MNVTTPNSSRFTGWYHDQVTPASKFYLNGTLVITLAGNDVTLADKLVVDGTSTLASAVTIGAYTLPTADGTNGQQLEDDGNGAVTWEDAA